MRRSFALAAALLAVFSLTSLANAQTVDEIVAKNLKAKGGAEKWKSINAVRMTGKVTVQGMELPLTIYAKRPNLSRQEITVQDRKIVQAFDGTTPWMINPMMGAETAQEIPGPQGEMMKTESDFDGALLDWQSKGHKVELVGNEKLDGKPVHHLKVTKKSGNVQHFYLDAESGIELKTTTEVDAAGTKQVIESEMSNYQSVDGIMLPHTIRQILNGTQMVQMTIDKVELNPALEEGLFKMPAK
jgi:outer membrane lipoprotein-sorting protein